MPKISERIPGGSKWSWDIEYDHDVTAAEVYAEVERQDHFGYHPAGYGGFLELKGHGLVVNGTNPIGRSWRYFCWTSCD